MWVVHRLDRDTSDVLVFARTREVHRSLNDQFENQQVKKIYYALIVGSPDWIQMRVDLTLQVDAARHHRTAINLEKGKKAVIDLRVLERFGNFYLVEAAPYTGRTHQTRVHLSSVGFPLLMDHRLKTKLVKLL